ncbi:MAG: DUF4296 domain-containing protein [Rhodothermaceae bacterium]|nr:DUF4296 domain-containing protein [Rhodothermaceae bacterium]
MARRSLLLFPLTLALIISAGCSPSPSDEETMGLVPDSIMAEIFIEFHLMEARSDLFQEDVILFRDSVFRHYDVDTSAYEKTMQYYSDNPEVYMEVYSGALDRLSDERYR